MSRIGRLPVPLPEGVTGRLEGRRLTISGPKGVLERDLPPAVQVTVENKAIQVARPSDSIQHRALHGLTRALINNMVIGVTKGFEKALQIEGTGYRASLQGKSLNLALGFSHAVVIEPPAGITFAVDGPQLIRVIGIDKERVGQVAADIRGWRPPEPYKGKGIRYQGEHVRRKVGKAGVK